MNKFPPLPKFASPEEKYARAMFLMTQEDADHYFERLVENSVNLGMTKEMAIDFEKKNLAHWAGFYSNEVRYMVEELFDCEHPTFGRIRDTGALSQLQILALGIRRGNESKEARMKAKKN